jgi:hypothetical protein
MSRKSMAKLFTAILKVHGQASEYTMGERPEHIMYSPLPCKLEKLLTIRNHVFLFQTKK